MVGVTTDGRNPVCCSWANGPEGATMCLEVPPHPPVGPGVTSGTCEVQEWGVLVSTSDHQVNGVHSMVLRVHAEPRVVRSGATKGVAPQARGLTTPMPQCGTWPYCKGGRPWDMHLAEVTRSHRRPPRCKGAPPCKATYRVSRAASLTERSLCSII